MLWVRIPGDCAAEAIAVASSRLLRMTPGRYSRVHTDGAGKGGARSGLGLLARDSGTGRKGRRAQMLSATPSILALL